MQDVYGSENALPFIALGFGSLIAVFAFWMARSPRHWSAMFHILYAVGLSLFGWSLWGVLAFSPIVRTDILITDWSTRILHAAFLGPLVWLVIIPFGCLLFLFATLIERN